MYIAVINISFFLVNLFVVITVIISDMDLSLFNQGWYLGLFTNFSYLILPFIFYWFMANYESFSTNPKKLNYTTAQLVFLIISILIAILPVFFTDLIGVNQTDPYRNYNFTYGWQILAGQATFWLLFLVLYVIAQDNVNRRVKDNQNEKKFIKRITITAIIVYSTPVFFVIAPIFILLSLASYVLCYALFYNGLEIYYSQDNSQESQA